MTQLYLGLKKQTFAEAKKDHCRPYSSVREIERAITAGDFASDDGDKYTIFDETGKVVYTGKVYQDEAYDLNTEGAFVCEETAKQEEVA